MSMCCSCALALIERTLILSNLASALTRITVCSASDCRVDAPAAISYGGPLLQRSRVGSLPELTTLGPTTRVSTHAVPSHQLSVLLTATVPCHAKPCHVCGTAFPAIPPSFGEHAQLLQELFDVRVADDEAADDGARHKDRIGGLRGRAHHLPVQLPCGSRRETREI